MRVSCLAIHRAVGAALVAVSVFVNARAEDDFVKDDEPSPPVQQPAFGGQLPGGGRVIVMPGLQLQFGGPGQLQMQGGVVAPQPPVAPEAGARPEPYLGVVAGPVMPQVRAQLDLPEGVGLSIDAVAAGGPAEKAGVKRFDVIHKFNDQVVCSADQLTTLVRVVGAGTKVSLVVLRGGRERELEAVIEERAVPAVAAGPVMQGMPEVLNLQPMGAPAVGAGFGPEANAAIERKVGEALARAGVGGGGWPLNAVVQATAGFQMVGSGGMSVTTMSGAQGTVEVRTIGGRRTVTVKDPDGKEVHSGPLDTQEDLDKVPEEYRNWVREMAGEFTESPALGGGDEPGDESPEQPAERATEDGPAEPTT